MSEESSSINLTPLRERSRGLLLGILMALIVFAMGWYLVSPTDMGVPNETKTSAPLPDAEQEPVYILLIGTDSRKGTALYTGKEWEEGQTTCKADVLTLVRIDPANQVLTFLTIPRDTLSIGTKTKINGWLKNDDPERTVQEVEKLTGVEIPYYMMVSLSGFEDIVNAIGGIVIDVPTNVEMLDPATGGEVKVIAGPAQQLDGAKALAVASAWDNTNELEPLRQMCVRAIEYAMVDKVIEGGSDLLRQAVSALYNKVTTNMDKDTALALANDYAQNRGSYTVYLGSGPYQGQMTNEGVWVVNRDEEAWKECMAVVDAGGNPNTVVVSLSSGA